MNASDALSERDDDPHEATPQSTRPDALLLSADDSRRAERRRAELHRRIAGDPLILLLLEEEAPVGGEEAPPSDGDGELAADAPDLASPARASRASERQAQPASTRRALAKGYTLTDVKNARERLKRIAIAIAAETAEEEA